MKSKCWWLFVHITLKTGVIIEWDQLEWLLSGTRKLTDKALPENGYFRLGDYYIDVGDHRVFHGDESRRLEPKAMRVLYQLALNAGETVSRQELMDNVWHGRVVIEDALTRIISQLRLTFDDSKIRQIIHT